VAWLLVSKPATIIPTMTKAIRFMVVSLKKERVKTAGNPRRENVCVENRPADTGRLWMHPRKKRAAG
jgi:hypothetical protein